MSENKRYRAAVVVIFAVFLVSACIWFLVWSRATQPTPTPLPPPTNTAVVEPTPTPRATATPQPTQTAVKPSVTPSPSPLPTNTPAQQPTLTATPQPTNTAVQVPTDTPTPAIIATRRIEPGGTYWVYAWEFYGDPYCWYGVKRVNGWHERLLPIGGIMQFTSVCEVHP